MKKPMEKYKSIDHDIDCDRVFDNQIIYDDLFIGAGLSSLSLLRALLEKGYNSKILILESDSYFQIDKTWCYWEQHEQTWFKKAHRHWNQWNFSLQQEDIIKNNKPAKDQEQRKNKRGFVNEEFKHSQYFKMKVSHSMADWSYCYLPAKEYFSEQEKFLLSYSNVHLYFFQQVQQIEEISIEYHKDTVNLLDSDKKYLHKQKIFCVKTKNKKYYAKRVFDSRVMSQKALLYQQFYGQELELENKMPCTEQVGLMENMVADLDGLGFVYILPLSSTKVLFEWTRFSARVLKQEQIKKEFDQALKQSSLKIKKVYRDENGLLPMGVIESSCKKNNLDNYYLIGTSSGALRQASGYGFLRIQKWAEKTAQQICIHGQPLDDYQYDTRRQSFLDQVFLRTLVENPLLVPSFMMSFAQNVSPEIFVRFMSDKATNYDYFKIMSSLPVKPFLKGALKELLRIKQKD